MFESDGSEVSIVKSYKDSANIFPLSAFVKDKVNYLK